MKFFKRYDRLFLLLVQCIGILIILQFNECGCFSKKRGDSRDGSIVMEIPSAPLVGDQRTVDITFKLENPNMTADLSNFTLEIAVRKQLGEGGSEISYSYKGVNTVKKTPPVVEVLSEVSPVSILTPANPSCKVALTFVPTHKTTELELELRLRNKSDEVLNDGTTLWKAAPKEAEIIVTRISPQDMKASDKTIKIGIENTGGADAGEGKTTLRIKRKEGSSAMIEGSTMTVKGEVYTLDLPFIGAGSTLTHDLIIDPKEDSKVTFSIQPQYNNTDIQTPFIVKWERGGALEVTETKYDWDTGRVRATVRNMGTIVTGGEVTVDVTTPGATLEEKTQKIIKVRPLEGGESREYDLGLMDIGSQQDEAGKKIENLTAVCKIGVRCPNDCPNADKPTVTQVCPRANIKLELEAVANEDATEVRLTIQNTGKDEAKGLKLMYKNISSDAEGRLATLAAEPENTIPINDLAALNGNKYEQFFKLDLKDADKAEFKFDVIYDNNSMASRIATFTLKPIKLKLQVISPSENNVASYILYGSENEVKLRIDKESDSRNIDLDQLSLAIQGGSDNKSTILTKKEGGRVVKELVGANLGALGGELEFYVNPAPGVKEANFSFQLKYKGKNIGEPIRIEWREYTLEIVTSGRLVGDHEGSFYIFGAVPIDYTALIVTLEGDNGTSFQLKDAPGKNQAPLSEVAQYDTFGDRSVNKNRLKPIAFKINEKNRQKNANVDVVIRRGLTEIARKSTAWVDEGIGLALELNRYFASDMVPLTIAVKNTTNKDLYLNNVIVRLASTDNLSFTLGNYSGVTVERSLAEILGMGNHPLNGETKIYTTIQADTPLGDKLVTGVLIELLDAESKVVISKEYFICYGRRVSQIIDSKAEKMLNNNGAEFNQELEKAKDNLLPLVELLTSLQYAIATFKGLSEKLQEIANTDKDKTGFAPLVSMLLTVNADRIEQWKTFEKSTQEAISKLNKDEKNIMAWCDEVEANIAIVKAKINNGIQDVRNLDTIREITNFLIFQNDKGKDFKEQSIKFLYQYYTDKLDESKALLNNRGENFVPEDGDSPSITRLKKLCEQMSKELRGIEDQIRNTLDAGFNKFDEVMQKQQNQNNSELKDKNVKKRIQEVLDSLKGQVDALKVWKLLTDYRKDLVTDADGIQNTLVNYYKNLAENNLSLAKVAKGVDTKGEYGNLTKIAELGVDMAREAFKIAQTTKSQSAQEAAIDTYKAVIETLEIYEHKRGASVERAKKPLLFMEDSTKEARLSVTVLQDLNSRLKSLKDTLKKETSKTKESSKTRRPFTKLFKFWQKPDTVNE